MPAGRPPEIKLDHLVRMSDCTGIIQHAHFSLPDRRTGYTTDDNARALIVAVKIYDQYGEPTALSLGERYLSYLAYAQTPGGGFHNFMDYRRRFVDSCRSEDCFGRAVWACGHALGARSLAPILAANAHRLLSEALPAVPGLTAIRARAFSILGLRYLLEHPRQAGEARSIIRQLADSLVDRYSLSAGVGWQWFEDTVTYSNGMLPNALFVAHECTGRKRYLSVATESLAFLTDTVMTGGRMRLVGNRGWYARGGKKAAVDEQPVDAAAMVLAYLSAYRATGRPDYLRLAEVAFSWFLGDNALGRPLYERETGGCYDGLGEAEVNLNQGAESLLAYLLAHLSLGEVASQKKRVAGAGS